MTGRGSKHLVGLLLGPLTLKLYRLLKLVKTYAERRELVRSLRRCGDGFEIGPPWDVRFPEYIAIGKEVFIGPDVLIIANEKGTVEIGDRVMFGPKVRVIPGSHRYDNPIVSMRYSGPGPQRPIVIGDDAWVAAGATILGGVSIGKGAVIGAGSVVTRSVGDFEIWAGNPARKVKDRFALPVDSQVIGNRTQQ